MLDQKKANPTFVNVFSLGKTYENREQYIMKVSLHLMYIV